MKNIQTTLILQAAICGTIAYKQGLERSPCLDKKFLELLSGREIGTSIPIFKAWLASWDAANISNSECF
jgi:hypothetical protein